MTVGDALALSIDMVKRQQNAPLNIPGMISNAPSTPSSGQDKNNILKMLSSRHIGCALLKPIMLVLKTGEEVELDVVWV